MRINALKKELLDHYQIFEEMLHEKVTTTKSKNIKEYYRPNVSSYGSTISSVLPSVSEQRNGLNTLSHMNWTFGINTLLSPFDESEIFASWKT